MLMSTDIHTHVSVHLIVYSRTISTLNILVKITECCLSDGTGWSRKQFLARFLTFLCFKAVLQFGLDFFVC